MNSFNVIRKIKNEKYLTKYIFYVDKVKYGNNLIVKYIL